MITISSVTPDESHRLLQCGFAARYFSVLATGENLDDYAYRIMQRGDDRREALAKVAMWLCAGIGVIGLPSLLLLGSSLLVAVGIIGTFCAFVWMLGPDLQTSDGVKAQAMAMATAKAQVIEQISQGRIHIIGRVDPSEAGYVLRVMGR
jgi:hypothetical protein